MPPPEINQTPVRVAYLDCFAGIAGDMFLGALIQVGVPAAVLEEATAALDLGASLRFETVDRSGISSIKVHVLEGGELAERGMPVRNHAVGGIAEQHQHGNDQHSHEHTQEHGPPHSHPHSEDHDSQHHDNQGRSLSVIRELIARASLPEPVKAHSIRAFELLGRSEAKIHNVQLDEIHFHEVGSVDAIVDIVASAAGIHHLRIGQWYSSAVNVGGGMVVCAHGTFPVPAPATADLLRGAPTYSAHIQKELVTPTGAALLRALDPIFGQQPAMRTEAVGYGAGSRNPEGFPNVLRLTVGTSSAHTSKSPVAGEPGMQNLDSATSQNSATHPQHSDTVTVLETALDDASPQVLAYVAEKALAEGALDVMLTPVIMKKGRLGTLVTLLCNPERNDHFAELLLRETGTLGIRIRQEHRICLDRSHATVTTPYGKIRLKIGTEGGEERNVAPEYEDCRAAATQHDVPLKVVQQAALQAFRAKA